MKRKVVKRKKVVKPKKRLIVRKIPTHLSRERGRHKPGGPKYTKRANQ